MGTIDELMAEWRKECPSRTVRAEDVLFHAAIKKIEALTRENERLTRELAAAIKLERVWRACWQSAEGDLKEIDRLLTESDSNIDVAHQIAIDAGGIRIRS